MSDEAEYGLGELTFSQAQGIEPLPQRLQLGELSKEARALIWAVVYDVFEANVFYPIMGGEGSVVHGSDWNDLLKITHIQFFHEPANEYDSRFRKLVEVYQGLFFDAEFNQIFDLIQFWLKYTQDKRFKLMFATKLSDVLLQSRAAYKLVNIDGDFPTIAPAATNEEGEALQSALRILKQGGMGGARKHLLDAIKKTNEGDFPGSVRDSIHAVESVAVVLDAGAATTLGPALTAIEAKGTLHPSLKKGFKAIYGYTSDEKGIRHALHEEEDTNVDEADALFMLGACASFVTYLMTKGAIQAGS